MMAHTCGATVRPIQPHLVARRTTEQAINRHAPEFPRDVPQRHVNAPQRVRHERTAAHVAMRSVNFLPEKLDARGVLAVEQLEEGIGQNARDVGIEAGDFAPAEDAVVGLDLNVCLGPDAEGLEGGNLRGGGAVGDVGGGVVRADGVVLTDVDGNRVESAPTEVTWDVARARKGGYDPAQYMTKRLWATAPDGTKVPMSIAYRYDAPLTSKAVIDACRPYDFLKSFPEVAEASKELQDQVRAQWKELF